MIKFVDIKKPEDIDAYRGQEWNVVADKNNYPAKFLNEQGEVVSSHYKGKTYYLVAKLERDRGFFERMGRITLGVLLSLMILPLLSANVRNLFSGKEIAVLRENPKDENPNQKVLGFDVAHITSFTIENDVSGNFVCAAETNIPHVGRPLPQRFMLDAVEVKDILNLLPKAVVQAKPGVDADLFAKVNYLKV